MGHYDSSGSCAPARMSARGGPIPSLFEPLEPRLLLSGGTAADPLAGLAEGNNAFAIDLYHALRGEEGNLFFSPFSISAALSMTYAGAANRTAEQMADVLHITQPADVYHEAFGKLIARLTAGSDAAGQGVTSDLSNPRSDPTVPLPASPPVGTPPAYWEGVLPVELFPAGGKTLGGDEFVLNIANSLWGQFDYEFLEAFLETLDAEYGSPLRPMNFRGSPEASRQVINGWVADQTRDRIPELIPEGAITPETLLTLVNAIYFNASWQYAFSAGVRETFHLPEGDLDVDMMRQVEKFGYLDGDGYQAVQLPYYGGDAVMTIVLPDEGQFEAFEASLSAGSIDEIVSGMRRTNVFLTMPEFECRQKLGLAEVLAQMGMSDAFDAHLADFSGMSETAREDLLRIDKVIHEAWVSVDKDGTEAAAATAVIMVGTTCVHEPPPPPVKLTIDRPFLFLIRDTQTNTPLFLGRICDAEAFGETAGPIRPSEPRPDPDPIQPDPTQPIVLPVERFEGPLTRPASIALQRGLQSDPAPSPSEIESLRQSLVALPRPKVLSVRGLFRANSMRWRQASNHADADEPGIRIDALDLHPARRAGLPDWLSSVLDELTPDGLLIGFRGQAL